jgi:hypothetical protein
MEVVMRWLSIGLLFLGCAVPAGHDPGMADLTFKNSLREFAIVGVYYRLAELPGYPESYWDVNRICNEGPLEPGEEISFDVEPNLYDLRCVGEFGATYTRYEVEITEEGYTWEVTQGDRDE